MSFRVQNTLSRRLEEFVPLEPGHARMYTCGPTVYNFAHIGNFRAYVFEDLLRRWLKFKGFRVTQVMNLTDVDDKTIRGSQKAGQAAARVHGGVTSEAFFEDLRALNIEPAEHYPAATDHIPEMIALIATLMDKGYAYRSEDGSVYFSIAKFPAYGKLAHLDLRGHARRRARGAGRIREGERRRLRAVEGVGREGRRRGLGFALGARAAGLAHRVLGHEHEVPGRELRHPHRRRGQHLPAPRGRDRPERGGHRAAVRDATGCTART